MSDRIFISTSDTFERMIEMSEKGVAIVFTGLRQGEKGSDKRLSAIKASRTKVEPRTRELLDPAGWFDRCGKGNRRPAQFIEYSVKDARQMIELTCGSPQAAGGAPKKLHSGMLVRRVA